MSRFSGGSLTSFGVAFLVATGAATGFASGHGRTSAAEGDGAGSAARSVAAVRCAADNGGISLPEGFCAVVVADSLGPARHLQVAANGDVFVALNPGGNAPQGGGVVALRDTDGDGVADVRRQWGAARGTGLVLHGGYLYFGANDAVLRYRLPRGSLTPEGGPDTLVQDLPARGDHRAKSLALDEQGHLFVNFGSATNSCQEQNRAKESPGKDPCRELEERAGIWRFDADRTHQTPADGMRYATGLRNTVALAFDPRNGQLYGGQHGRDQLFQNWPQYFDAPYSARNPAEEFVAIDQGDDFGWPYCFYSNDADTLLLAPEYGGDGKKVGRCAEKKGPLVAFPGHWAPDDLVFYIGSQFPTHYRGGAFIAFHGSWNRAPEPQAGYNVSFVPFRNGAATHDYEVFASGFPQGNLGRPGGATYRPSGLAMGPDGSLYVAEDRVGRVWRIVYQGQM